MATGSCPEGNLEGSFYRSISSHLSHVRMLSKKEGCQADKCKAGFDGEEESKLGLPRFLMRHGCKVPQSPWEEEEEQNERSQGLKGNGSST